MGMLIPAPYKFDPSGRAPENRVTKEQHIITNINFQDFHFIVPKFAPFFEDSLELIYHETGTLTPVPLKKGTDWYLTHLFSEASLSVANSVYGSITLLKRDMQGVITISYNTLGGDWLLDEQTIQKISADRLHNPRITYWEQVANLPYRFPVTNHDWNIKDLTGAKDVVAAILELENAMHERANTDFMRHMTDTNNPHRVTKGKIGLSQVANLPLWSVGTIDSESDDYYVTPKSLKYYLRNSIQKELEDHINAQNPHNITADTINTYTKDIIDSKVNKISEDLTNLASTGASPDTIKALASYFNTHGIGNASKLEGYTKEQLVAELKGLTTNATTLSGKTILQIQEAIKNEVLKNLPSGGSGGTGSGLSRQEIEKLINDAVEALDIANIDAARLQSKTLDEIYTDITNNLTVANSTRVGGVSADELSAATLNKARSLFRRSQGFPQTLDGPDDKGKLIPILFQRYKKDNPSTTIDRERQYFRVRVSGFSTCFKGPILTGINENSFTNSNFSGFTDVNSENVPEKYLDDLSKIGLNGIFEIKQLLSENDVPEIRVLNRTMYSRGHLFQARELLGYTNPTDGGLYFLRKDDPDDINFEYVGYYFYQRKSHRAGVLELLDNTVTAITLGSPNDTVNIEEEATGLTGFGKLAENSTIYFVESGDSRSHDEIGSIQNQINTLRLRQDRNTKSSTKNKADIVDNTAQIDALKDSAQSHEELIKLNLLKVDVDTVSHVADLSRGNFFSSPTIVDFSNIPNKPMSFKLHTKFSSLKTLKTNRSEIKFIYYNHVSNQYVTHDNSSALPALMGDEMMSVFEFQVIDSNTIICKI